MKPWFVLISFLPLYILGLIYLSPDIILHIAKESYLELDICSIVTASLLLLLLIICILFWIITMTRFSSRGPWTGVEIKELTAIKSSALSFYGAILIPLVTLCQVNSLSGTLLFWFSLLISYLLVFHGCSYEENPVLALLGYRLFCIKYLQGSKKNKSCTIITRGRPQLNQIISGRRIENDVYYVYAPMPSNSE